MNRKNLPSLLILDLLVMALAIGLFVFRYRSLQDVPTCPPPPVVPASLASSPAVALPDMTAAPAATVSTAAVEAVPDTMLKKRPSSEIRHIGFAYRNSRAKRVEIMGDFNDWTPQALNLGLDYKWTAALDIPPGEYAYNFIVDGKPVRDPNNPKICDTGRGYPNSFLKVNTLADDQKKNQ
jgi:hypothetical protein